MTNFSSFYARQMILPEIGETGQRALAKARVLCVGAGGLGSPALLYLAAAGVGEIGIIDDDRVEASNLQRQILFGHHTIGAFKSTQAAEILQAAHPHITVTAHCVRLHAGNAERICADYDVILDGADSFDTSFLINDVAHKLGKPWVYASILGFEGQLAVFRDQACLRCVFPHKPPQEVLNCAEAGIVGPVAGVLGSMQALEVIKVIVGMGALDGFLTFDFKTMDSRVIGLARDPDCPICSMKPEEIQIMSDEISIEEARAQIENGSLLIDVREQDEWDAGHIDGAQLAPLSRLMAGGSVDADKDAAIILHCKSGKRSMTAVYEVVKLVPTQIWNDYSARLEATEFAEIRPQVGGVITDIRFKEGDFVRKGDILFVIDPRPFKAERDLAKANVVMAETQLALAEKDLIRAETLINTNAISQRTFDQRQSEFDRAIANVEQMIAALEVAQIRLDYAYIKAPISGKTSRIEIKRGNVVEAGPQAPLLTSIVNANTIYANFDVDEASYVQVAGQETIPVKLNISSTDKIYEGEVDSFDNRLNIRTGTIRARAIFDNSDGILLPGMFAQIKMAAGNKTDQIIIPEKAIGTDQDRKFVLIVGDDNTAQYRPITIGASMNGSRVVTSGLSAGDKVIIADIIKLRPGTPIKPMTAQQKAAMMKSMQAGQQGQAKQTDQPEQPPAAEIEEKPASQPSSPNQSSQPDEAILEEVKPTPSIAKPPEEGA